MFSLAGIRFCSQGIQSTHCLHPLGRPVANFLGRGGFMTRRKLVVVATLFLLPPLGLQAADDKHAGEPKKENPRASAEKKKPSTLAEKISACLAERPKAKTDGSAPKDTSKTEASQPGGDPVASQSAATVKPNGAPLFSQYCSRCHSGGLDGVKAIGKLNAGQMPPPDEPQPNGAEKQALIEYFASQK